MEKDFGFSGFSEISKRMRSLQNDDPIGSIVICAHNEENYLIPTLDSISRQRTKLPIEIIGINNSSSDRTAEIMDSCGVKVFDEKRKGISYARNLGLMNSKGCILFQTDADTTVPENWVDAHFKQYEDPITVGVTGGITFDKVHYLYHLYRLGAITLYRLLEIFGRPNFNGGANLSYIRSFAVECGGFEEGNDKGEDRILQIKLSKRGRIRHIISDDINVITSGRRMNDTEKMKKS